MKNLEELKGRLGEKTKKGKKGGKREEKKGIVVKEEGKYPYFVSLFNIGPYDRQKSMPKRGKNFKKNV